MLAEAAPQHNGRLEWTLTRIVETLGCSRVTASESLTDLEKNGWIVVCRAGKFSGSRKPSLYRVTAQPSEPENEPATQEFLHIKNPPHVGRKKNLTGSNKTKSKFSLKPRQVPVETATAPKLDKNALRQTCADAYKPKPSSHTEAGEPIALGKLATQLLGESAFLRVATGAGNGAAREAFASAAPPPHAKPPARVFTPAQQKRH